MSEKTIRLIITRQDGPDAQAFDQEFEIPYRPNMNIISALMEIRRNPVDSKREPNNSDCLGYELLRGSMWCMFDGD